MDKDERRRLAERIAWLRQRGDQARQIAHARSVATGQSQAAKDHLSQRLVTCTVDQGQQQVLPLEVVGDELLLQHLFAERALPPLSWSDENGLSIGSDAAQSVISKAETLVKARRSRGDARQRL